MFGGWSRGRILGVTAIGRQGRRQARGSPAGVKFPTSARGCGLHHGPPVSGSLLPGGIKENPLVCLLLAGLSSFGGFLGAAAAVSLLPLRENLAALALRRRGGAGSGRVGLDGSSFAAHRAAFTGPRPPRAAPDFFPGGEVPPAMGGPPTTGPVPSCCFTPGITAVSVLVCAQPARCPVRVIGCSDLYSPVRCQSSSTSCARKPDVAMPDQLYRGG